LICERLEKLLEVFNFVVPDLLSGVIHFRGDGECLRLELSSPEISVVLGDGYSGKINFLLVHHDLSAHHEPVYLLGESSVVGEVAHLLAIDQRFEPWSFCFSFVSTHEFSQHVLARIRRNDVVFGLRFGASTHPSLHVFETFEVSSDKAGQVLYKDLAIGIELVKVFAARDLLVSVVSQLTLLGKAFLIGVFMEGKAVFSFLEQI
jgi:hypothetical protein